MEEEKKQAKVEVEKAEEEEGKKDEIVKEKKIAQDKNAADIVEAKKKLSGSGTVKTTADGKPDTSKRDEEIKKLRAAAIAAHKDFVEHLPANGDGHAGTSEKLSQRNTRN